MEIHAPLTDNGKIMHVSASTALRIAGGACKASALLLTPQDTENNTVSLTKVSKSKGIYSVWTKHDINPIWTGYSDSQWLKISRTKSN